MIKICPRCQQRYTVDETTEDYIHECGNTTASEVLRNEDVVVMGNWEDYTGSGIVNNVMMQGINNDIWGTRAWLEGGKVSEVTSRGNDADTHRVRKHLEFIKIK